MFLTYSNHAIYMGKQIKLSSKIIINNYFGTALSWLNNAGTKCKQRIKLMLMRCSRRATFPGVAVLKHVYADEFLVKG